MLDSTELRLLSRWCRARRMQWQPGVADDGTPAVLLLGPPRHATCCHGMMLLPDDSEWRLLDGPGRVLAAASGLCELLDALDAGVGEPAAPECHVIGGWDIGPDHVMRDWAAQDWAAQDWAAPAGQPPEDAWTRLALPGALA